MSLLAALPTQSVREVITQALSDGKRPTLHDIERLAALSGHSSIQVEIVLRSLVREGKLDRAQVFPT